MKCPRCNGLLLLEQLEWHGRYNAFCLLCGWRYAKPLVPDAISKGTAVLPVVVDVGKG